MRQKFVNFGILEDRARVSHVKYVTATMDKEIAPHLTVIIVLLSRLIEFFKTLKPGQEQAERAHKARVCVDVMLKQTTLINLYQRSLQDEQ